MVEITLLPSNPSASEPEPPVAPTRTPPVPPRSPDLTHWVSMSDWPERRHWFRKGDLIEFWRSHWYSHSGIYMGDGHVAHITTQDLYNGSFNLLRLFQGVSAVPSVAAKNPSVASAARAAGFVCYYRFALTCGDLLLKPSPPLSECKQPNQYYYRLDPIDDIAGDFQFRVNNLVQRTKDCVGRTWEETFTLVHRRLNGIHDYCLKTNNCEHVATFFRYKQKGSISLKQPRR